MMVQKHISVKGLDAVVRVVSVRFVKALATVSLGTLLVMASHAQGNLIANGSFETPVAPSGSWNIYSAGQSFDGGWTVESETIELLHTPVPGHVPAYHGYQWVDMDGIMPGAIYQDFTVSTGGSYNLQFAMNGNYYSHPHTYRQMRVQILQGLTVIFSQDYTHTYNNSYAFDAQPWVVHSASLNLSPGSYRLRFVSIDGLAPGYGPALDDVRLELVPEPASMVALGTGLVSLLGFRRRRQR